MDCSFKICFLATVSGWISWVSYIYIFSFIFSFFKTCNFLILTTLLTSASSVSVKQHAVYRTLQLVSPRSAHSSNLWRKHLKGCVKGERYFRRYFWAKSWASEEQLLLGIYYPSLHIAGIPFLNAKRNCERVIMRKRRQQKGSKVFSTEFSLILLFKKIER